MSLPTTHLPKLLAAATLTLGALNCATPAQAELLYGVDAFNTLVTFDSATPGSTLSSVPITGLSAQFEGIVGIDVQPSTGTLFALGNAPGGTYRLYTINTITGVATQVGSAVTTFSSSAFGFGFDFNPVANAIRITNNADENGAMSPTTGVYTPQTALTPGGLQISGSGYTNSFAGASTTTLYNIAFGSSSLYLQNPPAGGTQQLVGSLGFTLASQNVGFDISGATGVAYLADVSSTSGIYSVNLNTGAATLLGTFPDFLRDIAVAGTVPEPATILWLGVGATLAVVLRRRR